MKRTFYSLLAAMLPMLLSAQAPFAALDTNYTTNTVVVPASPLKYDVLFVGNSDQVYTLSGQHAPAKQNMDFTGVVEVGRNKAWLIVNHEITNTKNTILGDGGGQTAFRIHKKGGHWKTVKSINNRKFTNVDFSALGGTNTNCGGATSPFGTTLSAEEFPVTSNAQLWANGLGFSDTSDYVIPAGNGSFSGKTLKHWQNMGWMVEANPATAQAIKKCYAMGRFSHEGGVCMNDGKTVYLTDDFVPSVFFKFVADVTNDYTEGQLYAYKQGPNGIGGEWLILPRELDSLVVIRDIALSKGATIFTRWEWIVKNGSESKLYMTETGADVADYAGGIALGGTPNYWAYHLDTLYGKPADNKLTDYYGRVYEFNLNTNTLEVLIEGGNSTDMKTNFASPDGLTYGKVNGKNYLIINEDLIGTSVNRMPTEVPGAKYINEVFFLDLDIQNPTVDDLERFIIGPLGCETTGGALMRDGKTYIVNIQHPSSTNPAPFNNSATIAVSGFDDYIAAYQAAKENKTETLAVQKATDNVSTSDLFSIYPNPASRVLNFSKTTDIAIYTASGQRVLVARNTNSVDITGLIAGVYFVQNIDGQVQKLIIE